MALPASDWAIIFEYAPRAHGAEACNVQARLLTCACRLMSITRSLVIIGSLAAISEYGALIPQPAHLRRSSCSPGLWNAAGFEFSSPVGLDGSVETRDSCRTQLSSAEIHVATGRYAPVSLGLIASLRAILFGQGPLLPRGEGLCLVDGSESKNQLSCPLVCAATMHVAGRVLPFARCQEQHC